MISPFKHLFNKASSPSLTKIITTPKQINFSLIISNNKSNFSLLSPSNTQNSSSSSSPIFLKKNINSYYAIQNKINCPFYDRF
jgi:hypothetical protein